MGLDDGCGHGEFWFECGGGHCHDAVCVCGQLSVGRLAFDRGRCACLGHFGHRLLCELALHGIQFASAQIPHAFATP